MFSNIFLDKIITFSRALMSEERNSNCKTQVNFHFFATLSLPTSSRQQPTTGWIFGNGDRIWNDERGERRTKQPAAHSQREHPDQLRVQSQEPDLQRQGGLQHDLRRGRPGRQRRLQTGLRRSPGGPTRWTGQPGWGGQLGSGMR